MTDADAVGAAQPPTERTGMKIAHPGDERATTVRSGSSDWGTSLTVITDDRDNKEKWKAASDS